MSWTHVQIALGIDVPADLDSGVELTQFGPFDMLQLYGIAPFGVLVALLVAWRRRLWPIREHREFWFLLLLSLVLTALGMKSRRAMEYAIPCVIVLSGYSVRWLEWKWSLPTLTAALLLGQGYDTWQFYQDWWTQPQVGYSVWEFNAIAAIPARPTGAKVFNCDWSDSPYLLYFRPNMRFVDVLDPALLWKASQRRYILRRALLLGRFPDPASVLRAEFHADYVLCDEPNLDTQMAADRGHFEAIPIRGGSGDLRLYRLRSPIGAETPIDHR
jgi:hypothetical protein